MNDVVSAEPYCADVELTAEDSYVLLACDGGQCTDEVRRSDVVHSLCRSANASVSGCASFPCLCVSLGRTYGSGSD